MYFSSFNHIVPLQLINLGSFLYNFTSILFINYIIFNIFATTYHRVFLHTVSTDFCRLRSRMKYIYWRMSYVSQCFRDDSFHKWTLLPVWKSGLPVPSNYFIHFSLQRLLKLWSFCKELDYRKQSSPRC